jgi:hypothetical protein
MIAPRDHSSTVEQGLADFALTRCHTERLRTFAETVRWSAP